MLQDKEEIGRDFPLFESVVLFICQPVGVCLVPDRKKVCVRCVAHLAMHEPLRLLLLSQFSSPPWSPGSSVRGSDELKKQLAGDPPSEGF